MKIKNKTIEGNWYSPVQYLKNFKSVVYTTHLETSSSAGNWSGIFIQKIGKKYKVFTFSQENRYDGFSLNVGECFLETKKQLTNSRLDAIERLACSILFRN